MLASLIVWKLPEELQANFQVDPSGNFSLWQGPLALLTLAALSLAQSSELFGPEKMR